MVGGEGSKVLAERAPSNGIHGSVISSRGRMVTHQAANFSWLVDAGGGTAAALASRRFALPTKIFAATCITIRPLPILPSVCPVLGNMSATAKKPKVCVSV